MAQGLHALGCVGSNKYLHVLLAPDGQPAELWTYDSWGNPIAHEVNPAYGAVAQPFTWNAAYGYEWDSFADTGLYHVGTRAYDPRTARWLQRDPIDSASGDPNLYRYAGNAPLGYQDPNGLKPANKKRWGRKNCEDLDRKNKNLIRSLEDRISIGLTQLSTAIRRQQLPTPAEKL